MILAVKGFDAMGKLSVATTEFETAHFKPEKINKLVQEKFPSQISYVIGRRAKEDPRTSFEMLVFPLIMESSVNIFDSFM